MKLVSQMVLLLMSAGGCITQQNLPVSSEEYAVYGCILQNLARIHHCEIVFIDDTTLVNDPVPEMPFNYHDFGPGTYTPHIRSRLDDSWSGFDTDFYKREMNRVNSKREQLIVDSIRGPIAVRRRDWKNIRESSYAESYGKGQVGVFWVSRVAFNHSHTEALVYSDFACGYLCGNGTWYWLQRNGAGWVIHESSSTWAS